MENVFLERYERESRVLKARGDQLGVKERRCEKGKRLDSLCTEGPYVEEDNKKATLLGGEAGSKKWHSSGKNLGNKIQGVIIGSHD